MFAENIGVHLFYRPFFIFGLKAYHKVVPLPRLSPSHFSLSVIKMEEGKFKITAQDECLFTSKLHWFEWFRLHTPFPFKGRVTWTSQGAEISGLLPLGSTLFILFWVAGWSAGTIWNGDFINGLIGWLIVGVLVVISLPIEKRRMESMVEELRLIVHAQPKTQEY